MDKARILIVEDDLTTSSFIKEKIASFGYESAGVIISGEEAVERIQHINPDLVLMDISLSGKMDGIEAAENIAKLKNIPIIYLTVSTDNKTLREILKTRPYGYVPKPIDDNVLKFSIEIALSRHSSDIKLIASENNLKKSEDLYRSLVENIPLGVKVVDENFKIVMINKAAADIYGIKENEAPGIFCYQAAGKDAVCETCPGRVTLQTLQPASARMELPGRDGSIIKADFKTAIISDHDGRPAGFIEVIHDVTEIIRSQRELIFQSLLLNQIQARVVAVGIDGIVKYINIAGAEAYGMKRDDILGKNINTIQSDSILWDRKKVDTDFKKITFEKGFWHGILEGFKKSGETVYYDMKTYLMKNESGEPDGIISISTDVTDRVEAEKSFKKSDKMFRDIVEKSPLPIAVINSDLKIEYFNNKFIDLFGYTLGDISTLDDWFKAAYPDEAYRQSAIDDRISRSLSAEPVPLKSWKITCRNKTVLDVELVSTIIGESEIIIFNDVTQQKNAEELFRKNEIIDSIGLLAGGIAHDFNNLLSAILGNISLAKIESIQNDKMHEILDEAEKAGLRAKDLAVQLLTFSKGGEPVKKIISIKKVINEVADFALSGSVFTKKTEIPDGLWNISADENQLSQVLYNLILNARQAMTEKGEINIKAANVHLEKNNSLSAIPGDYVLISISDQGSGISPDKINRIFTPYFTTKETGTGLGLTVAHSIVKRHFGYLAAESDGKTGSTFRIYLPASFEEIDVNETLHQKKEFSGKKILLMDDEEIILNVTGRMLEKMKFKVIKVKTGDEAISEYREALKTDFPVDLVILDLTIPGGRGGRETIDELKKIDPGVKALVSSGYSNDPVMANFQDYGFIGILAKPYMFEEILDILYKFI